MLTSLNYINNPIIDTLNLEPCYTLTTNGGYTLTPQGERVLAFLRGRVADLAIPELMALKSVSGCGVCSSTGNSNSYSGSFSSNQNDDPITNILNSLFG